MQISKLQNAVSAKTKKITGKIATTKITLMSNATFKPCVQQKQVTTKAQVFFYNEHVLKYHPSAKFKTSNPVSVKREK